MAGEVRVGIGYDIHRLVRDRPLILAGIAIEHDRGLLGHTDGDVVLHAITDALLGAAALGDIGELFPDTDPKFKNADSRTLLADVLERVKSEGFTPVNLDVIVHAERPKLTEYKGRMAKSIADVLGLERDRVNVKAKTAEGLGPVGKRDAVACTAVVSMTRT